MSFAPAGGNYQSSPNPVAGFEEPYRGGGRRWEREEREGKENKERDGRKQTLNTFLVTALSMTLSYL